LVLRFDPEISAISADFRAISFWHCNCFCRSGHATESYMAYPSEELRLPGDLGGRIVRAARLAMVMHCTAAWQANAQGGALMQKGVASTQAGVASTNVGRQPKTGRAGSGAVTDDLPAGQAAQPSQWTLAGENPAGSFQ
jgi:hypothetical protein